MKRYSGEYDTATATKDEAGDTTLNRHSGDFAVCPPSPTYCPPSPTYYPPSPTYYPPSPSLPPFSSSPPHSSPTTFSPPSYSQPNNSSSSPLLSYKLVSEAQVKILYVDFERSFIVSTKGCSLLWVEVPFGCLVINLFHFLFVLRLSRIHGIRANFLILLRRRFTPRGYFHPGTT